ncbi:large ribosomal subunit protein eL20z-like [Malania oleifera]|uniref:large ribosomal subunit protein eL20z-like n=1 Tax=Malania oleifera TaxID=397392 RepID=UPI0025AE09C6|nr:large ribosomal subunit protein eL20z-like [Malania oleifera]
MTVEGKSKEASGDLPPQHQLHYGTFQGIPNYPPPLPQPVIGFPQPVPPPAANARYYPFGYQNVHTSDNHNPNVNIHWNRAGYPVAEGRPIGERRLPCCGIGFGWFLFIIGFFLAGIPWYIGAFLLLATRVDYREKPGYIACTIAAILALIATTFGVTKATNAW